MKTGFVIESQSEYRQLGPLIDELLLNKEDVYIFINSGFYSLLMKNSIRPWLVPNQENVPNFMNGKPMIVFTQDEKDICEKICNTKPDQLFFHSGVHPDSNLVFRPRKYIQYLKQELNRKTKFYSFAGEYYDSALWGLEAIQGFDNIFIINEHAKKVQFDILNKRNYEKQDIKNSFNKLVVSGKPVLDHIINQKIPDLKDSVILMTHNFSNSQFSRICFANNKYIQLLKIFIKEDKFDYKTLSHLFKNTSYKDIISTIYKSSKGSKLNFIIQSRAKDSQNKVYQNFYALNSDIYNLDGNKIPYPNINTHQMIMNSKKLIAFKSFSFIEAVISKTKALHLEIPTENAFHKIDKYNIFNKSVRGCDQGSLNNYKSCIQSIKWHNLKKIEQFIEKDEPILEHDRNEYLEKYVYPPNFDTSSEFIYKTILENH